ncbi:MAG: aminotransferase class V-fold PLP-dependent enzyme, partial [Deltaproteobacteria bacterium]|nr:aminotransferase class V-fold PLP-dependent enzyme [Deltaproteobacteria bacterium]
MEKLALTGGSKTRTKPFTSRPHVDENERKYWAHCLEEGLFSRFVGSPVKDYREQLAMTSEEALTKIEAFWSVLGGPYVRKFEAEFARKHGVKYAVASNSATSSITSAAIAAGIKPGDEVISSPFSFTATATALRIAGARLVFADIDPETYCITLESIKKRVTPKTKAIVPVHILGNAGDIVRIRDFCAERGITLLEDSAQAIHSRKNGQCLGTFGAAGMFSFQETKNIMTGEGGMAI